ncbi:hypothetical protein [Halobellus ordinarius]|uniref:hypothetical protein n=1 Tax=Halobellus ordinarius TaxID=3075120 RepID=UPI0028803567|nr:hypothetical protein [Halobellus sp. ZY16]
MSKTCRPSPSTVDAEWTVRQVVPRSDWDAAVEPCPTCGDDVDLRESHYQVELDRERTPGQEMKLTRERRLLSFCDEACATAWLDSAASP